MPAICQSDATSCSTALPAFAGDVLPSNGTVTAGSASIVRTNPSTLNINQGTNQAIINWNSFSVGRGDTVNFNQPGTSSATLNRVTGATPSWIAGTINAPGTVLLVNPANFINTSLYANLKFNFVTDIAPVAAFNRVPNVMTVNKDVPAKNVAEFIAYAKANPGKINMASSGNGTSVHLSGEMFMAMTGVKMQHVPYRGAAPAITDLLGGQVQVIFDNMPSIIQHIRGGAVRALGVTTTQRSPQLPDVQAISETVPGYEASALFGMGAPAKTPKEIIGKLNSEINAILAEPDMTKRLVELGGAPTIQTPEAFGDQIRAETDKWKKVVDFAGIKVE